MSSNALAVLSDSLAALVETLKLSLFSVEGARAPATATHLRDDLLVSVAHVMGRARDGVVRDLNGAPHVAHVVGMDHSLDLCLLRVEGVDQTAPHWRSDSIPVGVGSLVALLGAWSHPPTRGHRGGVSRQHADPVSVRVSATLGVVSRSSTAWRAHTGAQLDSLIDIDATLRRCAAGGPAVAADGVVLGINTFGLRRGGTTIPSVTIAKAVEAILSGKVPSPGRLGVGVQAVHLHAEQAATAGTEVGLLITSIAPPSAAHRGGLGVGDVLLRYQGEALLEVRDLQRRLAHAGGQTVRLDLLRGLEALTIEIEVEAVP